MDANENLLGTLIERAEQFTNTNIELVRLKSLEKVADVTSTQMSRLLPIIAFSVFLLILTIAAGLWLGELLGKNYFGFSVVALVYGFIGVILLILQPQIKKSLNNSIIKQIFN